MKDKLKEGKLDEISVKFYAAQLVLGLEYLHNEMGMAHRDLKPGNIMLTKEDYIKIVSVILEYLCCLLQIDFGESKVFTNDEELLAINKEEKEYVGSCVGTPLYVAPEMLDGCRSGFFSDFWALGNVIFEMSVGHAPFRGKSNYIIFNNIEEGMSEYPKEMDPNLVELLSCMLNFNFKDRATACNFIRIKQHPYFS